MVVRDFQWDVKELLERQNIVVTPRGDEEEGRSGERGERGKSASLEGGADGTDKTGSPQRERGVQGYSEDVPSAFRWLQNADEVLATMTSRAQLTIDAEEDLGVLNPLLKQVESCHSFFGCAFESNADRIRVQRTIYAVEKAIEEAKKRPPPVIGFEQMRQKEGGSNKKRKIQLGEE